MGNPGFWEVNLEQMNRYHIKTQYTCMKDAYKHSTYFFKFYHNHQWYLLGVEGIGFMKCIHINVLIIPVHGPLRDSFAAPLIPRVKFSQTSNLLLLDSAHQQPVYAFFSNSSLGFHTWNITKLYVMLFFIVTIIYVTYSTKSRVGSQPPYKDPNSKIYFSTLYEHLPHQLKLSMLKFTNPYWYSHMYAHNKHRGTTSL